MASRVNYSWPISLDDGYKQLKPSNFVEKGLFWLYDKETPRIQKIIVVALGLIAHMGLVMLGASLASTSFWLGFGAVILLSSPLAGIIFAAGILHYVALTEVSKMCFEMTKGALGGEKVYKAIPKFGKLSTHLPEDEEALRAALKTGGMDYVWCLGSEHFSNTMTRGKDLLGRHFVVFKLREKKSENPRDVMMFLWESFNDLGFDSNGRSWNKLYLRPGKEKESDRLPVTELKQIMEKKHPDYELAE